MLGLERGWMSWGQLQLCWAKWLQLRVYLVLVLFWVALMRAGVKKSDCGFIDI